MKIARTLFVTFALFLWLGGLSYGAEFESEAFKNEKWFYLWSEAGTENQFFVREESIASVDTSAVVYRVDLLTRWSPKIAGQVSHKLGGDGAFLPQIVFQVEMDMTHWAYRIVKTGSFGDDKTTWLYEMNGEWVSLAGSGMIEPMSELAIYISADRERYEKRAKRGELRPPNPLMRRESEGWIEFDNNEWGRTFYLPSSVKKMALKDDNEGLRILIRTDWSLRAQRELPEFENLYRQEENMRRIQGLEQTEVDYMLWVFDIGAKKESYLAGAYLAATNHRIHKEDNFLSFAWKNWHDPVRPGIAAAYALSHPNIEKWESDPQEELDPQWSGIN